MSEHVNHWTGAYQDGELPAERRARVEAHLAVCPACRQELEATRRLSTWLQAAPLPQGLPTAQAFAADLAPRLPARAPAAPRWSAPGLVWWLIPLAILGAWTSAQLVYLVKEWSWALAPLGLAEAALAWLAPDLLGYTWLELAAAPVRQALQQAGSAWLLELAAAWQGDLLLITLNTAAALLYLAWLAGLSARRIHLAIRPVQSSEILFERKEN